MISFQQLRGASGSPLALWCPAFVCLGAAAIVAIVLAPRVLPVQLTAGSVLTHAVAFISAIAGSSAIAGLIASALLGVNRTASLRGTILRLSAASVWFGPSMILAGAGYWWCVLPMGFAAVPIARLLRNFALAGAMEVTDDPPSLTLAVMAALLLQSGTVSAVARVTEAAFFLTAFGCGLIAWVGAADHPPQKLSRSGVSIRLLLPLLATAFALMLGTNREQGNQANHGQTAKQEAIDSTDRHSGVILTSPVRPHVKLVAPPSLVRKPSGPLAISNPVAFPFSGEYWFYYWPLRRPPASSLVTSGTPLTYNFTAPLRTYLSMEARQPLPMPMAMSCCGGIEVHLTSADSLPQTIAIEVLLANMARPDQQPESLGQVNLRSMKETLRFPFQRHTPMTTFDQIRVIFHLQESRSHRSANVAIDTFRLLPPGT